MLLPLPQVTRYREENITADVIRIDPGSPVLAERMGDPGSPVLAERKGDPRSVVLAEGKGDTGSTVFAE